MVTIRHGDVQRCIRWLSVAALLAAVIGGGCRCALEQSLDPYRCGVEGCSSPLVCVEGFCVLAPDAGRAGSDSGESGTTDSGKVGADSSVPGTDSGAPGTDSGAPGTDSGIPSCVDQYGAAPEFKLCMETAMTCVFNAATMGGNCNAMCSMFGGTCVAAMDNITSAGVCVSQGDDTCDTNRSDEICVCTRG